MYYPMAQTITDVYNFQKFEKWKHNQGLTSHKNIDKIQ